MKVFLKIIIISIITTVGVLFIADRVFAPQTQFKDWPSECGSSFFIVYEDPTKHNPEKIQQILMETYQTLGEMPVNDDWWENLEITSPDEEGIASFGMPGIIMKEGENYTKFIEKLMALNGVSEIKPGKAWCI